MLCMINIIIQRYNTDNSYVLVLIKHINDFFLSIRKPNNLYLPLSL